MRFLCLFDLIANDKQILKFIWKYRGPSICRQILKNKFGGLEIKTQYKAKIKPNKNNATHK